MGDFVMFLSQESGAFVGIFDGVKRKFSISRREKSLPFSCISNVTL
jgi:hypothetical protein